MLLVQSIQITDKFGFEKQQGQKPKNSGSSETVFFTPETPGLCVNGLGKLIANVRRATIVNTFSFYPGLIVAGTVFLLAQLAVIAIWTFLWQRRRKQRSHDNGAASAYGGSSSSSAVPTPTLPGSRSESMSKLYDHSFASRHGMGRQF